MSEPFPASIVSSFTPDNRPSFIIDSILEQITTHGPSPRAGILYASIDIPMDPIIAELSKRLNSIPIIGCTSCLGPANQNNFHPRQSGISGLWLLGDGFRFATSQTQVNCKDYTESGENLARQILERSGITASEVRFAIIHAVPGHEEELLKGIYQVLPPSTLIIGGSAADNDLSGKWSIWTEKGSNRTGAALAICDWPWKIATAFRSGYLPSTKSAIATRSVDRTLHELDFRPAAEVYNEWMGQSIQDEVHKGGIILAKTTFSPLGVARAQLAGIDTYVLIHPERVIEETKSLQLFADIREGERVTMMRCSERALIQRSEWVTKDALRDGNMEQEEIAGALMIYCGGCVLAIEEQVASMLHRLHDSLGHAPSVTAFTYGEQGCITPRRVEHGNLMASILLLSTHVRDS